MRPPSQGHAGENRPVATTDEIIQAINEGGQTLVQLAERVGRTAKNQNLTTSQIRNIFGLVKRMEMRRFDPHEFAMLKPKMAYAAARASGRGAKTLADVLSQAIDAVGNDQDRFKRFVDLFEAILAYHKAAGGR